MESRKEIYPVDGGFLQSSHWANFQQEIGRKVIEGENEYFKFLMIFYKLPIVGGYFFVPRGPIFSEEIDELKVREDIKKMIEGASKAGAGWVRIEPQTKNNLETIEKVLGKRHRIVKSKKDHEPKQTIMLDLLKDEEEILVEMKQKTRYNIRLSKKKGVVVENLRGNDAIEKFLFLTKTTAQRDGITAHPDWYYRKMIESIPEENLQLYLASYEGKIIAANLVSFFGGVSTYLHGASSNENRNVMAPFALQWQTILDAKKMGCKKYDFGGTMIDKEGKCKGSWSGISRFKQGFCPRCELVEFPGCWDIIVDSKKYFIYKLLQFVKDKLKRLKK